MGGMRTDPLSRGGGKDRALTSASPDQAEPIDEEMDAIRDRDASGLSGSLAPRQPSGGSAPARLFAQIDAKRSLRNDFVRQERVGRMEPAAARVAEQLLQFVAAE